MLSGVAVLAGVGEFILWALSDIGCIGALETACYGPQSGLPAAPGYWPGELLAGFGGLVTLGTLLIGLVATVGIRAVRTRLALVVLWALLVSSAAAAFMSFALLRARPSGEYCAKVHGCYSD
ncbi:MAG: hypothetical protein J2O48_12605 [Solirubrobacterales bacterium]|nr:hypothetical protein [Solirubrobacterales bacterium]